MKAVAQVEEVALGRQTSSFSIVIEEVRERISAYAHWFL